MINIKVSNMQIREATVDDFEQIWPIFKDVISTGDTYLYPADTSKEQAYKHWISDPTKTYVAVEDGVIYGTYKLSPNTIGRGNHVCNCGYMVAKAARGRGIAANLCKHSQIVAQELGFKAMQFNMVVSTNDVAVGLWKKLGFSIVGTIPRVFHHEKLGYVDSHVMYKWLQD